MAELSTVRGCVAIILFGSAARGELRPESDLDLLVLFDVEHRPDLGPEGREASARANQVQARHDLPWPVSLMLARADLSGLDPDFLTWVAAEGTVLWVRTDFIMRLQPDNPRLEPYVVIRYDQAKLSPLARAALHRALFGYQTSKTVKGRHYQTQRPGIVQFPAERLGSGVLLVPAHLEAPILEVLKRHGADYGRTPVWR